MPRFFRSDGEGDWDIDDLKRRTGELVDFLKRAREAYGIGAPLALGYSNGANIAWSLILAEPQAFSGAILMRAMLPFDPRPLPDLANLPMLMLDGPARRTDPVAAGRAARRAARRGRRRRDL